MSPPPLPSPEGPPLPWWAYLLPWIIAAAVVTYQ